MEVAIMNILQGRPRGAQDAHLSLIQYLRKNAPGLVAVETEVVTVEGGTFEQENLSLRVRRGESVNNAMGKARSAARPWLQANSSWANEEE
jgi:hypothetical protein